MSDDSQILVPASFVSLFLAPGRARPSEPKDVIAARHELCEDMAQMLSETARARKIELGVTEADVLERVHAGLREAGVLGEPEARWVVGRLAELLDWPRPAADS